METKKNKQQIIVDWHHANVFPKLFARYFCWEMFNAIVRESEELGEKALEEKIVDEMTHFITNSKIYVGQYKSQPKLLETELSYHFDLAGLKVSDKKRTAMLKCLENGDWMEINHQWNEYVKQEMQSFVSIERDTIRGYKTALDELIRHVKDYSE